MDTHDLRGRTMVNIVSGESFHIYDKNSSRLPRPPGWLSLRTMEDEINHILSRAESKFCAPNAGTCTSKTVGLLVRRHIVTGEFHFIGKEASTRWAGEPDPSTLADAGVRSAYLSSIDEIHRQFAQYFTDASKNLDVLNTVAGKIKERAIDPSFQLLSETQRQLEYVKKEIEAVDSSRLRMVQFSGDIKRLQS